MKLRYLSLFSGIEAAGIWHALGWECVGLAEIEPFPCKVLAHHYPGVPNLGSVTEITEAQVRALGHIDVVVFGSPCFVAGTKVLTKLGFRPIEQVRIGDRVLTHTGAWHQVLKTGADEADTIIVRAQGIKPTETTHDHPYYVREMRRVWDNTHRRNVRVFSKPVWKSAGLLTKGDFIGLSILKTEENPLELTQQDCWLLGRYIADGHSDRGLRTELGRETERKYKVIFSIGDSKLDHFNRITEYAVYSAPHTPSTHRFVISSKRLALLCEEHGGCLAMNKHFSMTLLNLPVQLLAAVLEGYMSGDGCYTNDKFKASSISEDMIMCLNLAIAKVHRVNSSFDMTERPATTVICGRTVNQKDTISVTFNKEMRKHSKAVVIDDIIWLPIKSVTPTGETRAVYNLEVETDNSYTANNAIVHNCQDVSIAGKRKGFTNADGSSTRSGLFFTALQIAEWSNARFSILENVPGLYSSNSGADFAAVVGEMAGARFDVPKKGWPNTGVALGQRGLVEWVTLDAQFIRTPRFPRAVPQRRRRVFVVRDSGDWASRPPLFLEPESLCGNPPPSRKTGKDVTADASRSVEGCCGTIGARTDRQTGAQDAACGHLLAVENNRVSPTINAAFGSKLGLDNQHIDGGVGLFVFALAGNAIGRKPENGGNHIGYDDTGSSYTLTKTDVHAVACFPINTQIATRHEAMGEGTGMGIGDDGAAAYTLQAAHSHAVAFQSKDSGHDVAIEHSPTICNQHRGVAVAYSFDSMSSNSMKSSNSASGCNAVDVAKCQDTSRGLDPACNQGGMALATDMQVRRLTPVECARLQAFPDSYLSQVPGVSDTTQYKALGNSMARNVMDYLGMRIEAVTEYIDPPVISL